MASGLFRWVVVWLFAAMLVAEGAGCHCVCRCNAEGTGGPVDDDPLPGTTTVTLDILPTGEVHVDGARVEVADLPALLRARDAGAVIYRYVGEKPSYDQTAPLDEVVLGPERYAFGEEWADEGLRR
ncbi:MAG: hypothetical protein HY722_03480 [Planctomycetes bacterium]|nr:hypothetical protein [Planctomycetota bacterium]